MVLADKGGNLWFDGEQPPESVTKSVLSNATLCKHPKFPVLFRVESSGQLTMYDIGHKPFSKVTISQYEREIFTERREVYTDAVHVYELCRGLAQVIGDDFSFLIPMELMLCD